MEKNINTINYNLLNGGALAYIGDAVYEEKIRKYCLDKGITSLNKLNKECVRFVSRTAQNKISLEIEFNEVEKEIFKRGRNHNYKTKTAEYINASGFEAVIGYLYLNRDFDRLDEIIREAIEIIEK